MVATIRKALVPLVVAASALVVQWWATGHFNLTTEFVTTLFGAVTAVLVYLVPNLLSSGLASVRKALVPLGTAAAAVIVQWVTTGHFNLSQEFTSSLMGVLTALFVYWVPNAGQLFNWHRELF